MKIIIAYDGAHPVERMIGDLKRAGLPDRVKAVVLTADDAQVCTAAQLAGALANTGQGIEKESSNMCFVAHLAAAGLRKAFPHWQIEVDESEISPAWAIVGRASKLDTDLIVMGSHEASVISKALFGSVIRKVLIEAECSVRIVKHIPEELESPARIVIGVDGSEFCERAVGEVARRQWKKGTSALLVTVLEPLGCTANAFNSAAKKWGSDSTATSWIKTMHEYFANELRIAGLNVSSVIAEGKPKAVLCAESEKWGADSIFLGSQGLNHLKGYSIGPTAREIAEESRCNVEIVRTKHSRQLK
jgi:nucleotide-binding universal stress UspA family protein